MNALNIQNQSLCGSVSKTFNELMALYMGENMVC